MSVDVIPEARLRDCLAVTRHGLQLDGDAVVHVTRETGGLFNFVLRVETSGGVVFFKQYLDDVPNPLYNLPKIPASARARLACDVQRIAADATRSLGQEVVPEIIHFDDARCAFLMAKAAGERPMIDGLSTGQRPAAFDARLPQALAMFHQATYHRFARGSEYANTAFRDFKLGLQYDDIARKLDPDEAAAVIRCKEHYQQRAECITHGDLNSRNIIIGSDTIGVIDFELEHGHALAWRRPTLGAGDTAFLQYTSGSTSAPKGVVVAHGNLLHNLASLTSVFKTGEHTRVGSWLPPYHDMGLIGCILLPAYNNAPAYFISPIRFIQKPMRWLEAISRYQITISAAPNFGYEYCLQRATPETTRGLDLRSWDVACVGAEPVRPSTLARFAETFAPCGFDAKALRPGYGLAESTLLVASGPPVLAELAAEELGRGRAVAATGGEARRTLVGINAFIAGQQLSIVDPATRRRCPSGHVGEIWLQSPSVAGGYWNNAAQTAATFQATLADEDAGAFLRTGDLGFLAEGALYVTGRLKELIIIRGANYYPQDFEAAAAASHAGVNAEQAVAFSAEQGGAEHLVLVVEVTRPFLGVIEEIQAAVRDATVHGFGLAPFAVVPVKRGALPKTSSGKKERATTRQQYLRGELVALAPAMTRPAGGAAAAPKPPRDADRTTPAAAGAGAAIERWLVERIAVLTGTPVAAISPTEPFARYGLDSVKAVELTGALQDHLGRKLSPTLCFEFASPRLLAHHLGDVPMPPHSPALGPAPAPVGHAPGSNAVAIVGMGCRFPGAHGVAAYWDLLRRGVDAIADVPADRWDADAYVDPDGKRAGSMVSRSGGFIEQVDQFDREFFGISPREAEQMDPQQRILMQRAQPARGRVAFRRGASSPGGPADRGGRRAMGTPGAHARSAGP